MALNESLGKLISHYLQIGGDPCVIVRQLAGVSCHQVSGEIPSCVSAIADAIREHTDKEK